MSAMTVSPPMSAGQRVDAIIHGACTQVLAAAERKRLEAAHPPKLRQPPPKRRKGKR